MCSRIAHLGDIHVADRRRPEYAEVFSKLYECLKEDKPDVIVVAGDVFDNKMRASANNIADVLSFLASLVRIAPVVMIPGNHDTNVLTPAALDLLTPIVTEHQHLQPPALHYWRSSGHYEALGMRWTVKATDGPMPPPDPIRRDDSLMDHIFLFHEEVNTARLPNGTVADGHQLSLSDLEPFDLAMGGHIHERQLLSSRAGYCGSLVQQNIGECHTGHGYILWVRQADIAAGTRVSWAALNRDIYNPYGYVSVKLRKGVDCTKMPLPSAPKYWSVSHDGFDMLGLDSTITHYTQLFGTAPREIIVPAGLRQAADAVLPEAGDNLRDAQAAARDIVTHEQLIGNILGAAHPRLDDVIQLHREHYSGATQNNCKGGRFRLVRFEFENLYRFGGMNVIDFSSLENCVSGVIAPNRSGKSGLIEALLFAIYDIHPRSRSKKDIVHHTARGCRMALDFTLDGKAGRIEKGHMSGSKDSASQYRLWYDGEDLTGGGTIETNKAILALLGDPQVALSTSFVLQDAGLEFVCCEGAARKTLVASVLALGRFASIEKIMTAKLSETNGELKAIQNAFRGTPLHALREEEESVKTNLAMAEQQLAKLGNTRLVDAALRTQQATQRVSQGPGTSIRAHPQDIDIWKQIAAAAAAAGWTSDAAQLEAVELPSGSCTLPAVPTGIWPNYDDMLSKLEAFEYAAPNSALIDALKKELQQLNAGTQAAAVALGLPPPPPTKLTAPPIESAWLPDTPSNNDQQPKHALHEIKPDAVKCAAALLSSVRDSSVTRQEAQMAWLSVSDDIRTKISALSKDMHAKLMNMPAGNLAETKAKLDKVSVAQSAKQFIADMLSKVNFQDGCASCDMVKTLAVCGGGADECAVQAATQAYNTARLVDAERKYAAWTAAEETHAARELLISANYWIKKCQELNTAWDTWNDEFQLKLAARTEQIESQYKNVVATPADPRPLIHKYRQAAAMATRISTSAQRLAEYAEAEAELQKAMSDEQACRLLHNELSRQVGLLSGRLEAIATKREDEEQRQSRLQECQGRAELYECYRRVIKPKGGIADQLLDRARSDFESSINGTLRQLGATFEIQIGTDYSLDHRELGGSAVWLDIRLASGYQKFALGLASRLVMWRESAITLPDAIIIDEGFGSCDEINLESVGEALESLAASGGQKLLFIVSHLDALKSRIERPLTIDVGPIYSRVANTQGSTLGAVQSKQKLLCAPRELPPAVMFGEGKDYTPQMRPDNLYWCPACDKTVTPSWYKRHVASGVHAKAVLSKEKAATKCW